MSSSAAGDGYTCTSCGGYVPYGVSHSCPTTKWINPLPPYVPPTTDSMILERIAKALERIADTLDR